ncbi:hypothetical protein G5I_00078 [Acromyrmex echinatior]|uniref:Uncharacterized protein n=1 Tax=Acromyrmex echinatior TaxID=103372 RepID=F4W3X7_ACREC|nr:hypothetical protein G5I_00078 [Acromyrmex echinatior]
MCTANQHWTNPHRRTSRLRQSGSANSHRERNANCNHYPESPTTKLDNVRESGIIKYSKCYTSVGRRKEALPEGFDTLHPLGLFRLFRILQCMLLTATLRTLAICPECPEILDKFIAYLNRTGEQPWNYPESKVCSRRMLQINSEST